MSSGTTGGAHTPGLRIAMITLLIVLLSALAMAIGHALQSGRRAAAIETLVERWDVAEPQSLDPGTDDSPRVSALQELERTFDESLALRSSTAQERWLPLALALLGCIAYAALALALRRERHSVRSFDEGRTRLQQSAILKLLDEMTPLSDGDLTVRATVDESMTGALADAFNQAVSELRRLVSAADRSASDVGRAVADTRGAARALAASAAVQSREILRASNYLNAMSGATAELSMNAASSADKASEVQAAAGEGRDALLVAGTQLERIRDEASLTMRLTHRLAENVRAIDNEVATVRAIAARSELLSLNTTVRAAAVAQRAIGSALSASGQVTQPGDERATADYARLADDVSDLSSVLVSVSREIESLTGVIRDDADETLRAMATTEAALGAGVDGTRTLYRHLATIETSATGLDSLIGDTARRAARQAEVVRRLSDNMAVVNRLGRDGNEGLAAVGASLDKLQALADGLESAVSDFRLPGEPDRERNPARG